VPRVNARDTRRPRAGDRDRSDRRRVVRGGQEAGGIPGPPLPFT